MKEVKVCIVPRIVENEDKWGRGLGTYRVEYYSGYIREDLYRELHMFQRYSMTKVGSAETSAATAVLAAGGTVEDASKVTPVMGKMIERAHGLLWQFNAREEANDQEESSYIRMTAAFNQITINRWNKKYDETAALLKTKVDIMNGVAS